VAVVTDGTAVLGWGHRARGGHAGHGGKAMLFQGAGRGGCLPDPLDTKDPGKIVETVKMIAPAFGWDQTWRTSRPRAVSRSRSGCGRSWTSRSFHDDQHGTAVVVLAALFNALKIVKKDIRRIKVVVSGVGAAGTATIKILLALGPGTSSGSMSTGRFTGAVPSGWTS